MATILSTPTTVTVTTPGAGLDKAADWKARTTAPGVVWAENWSSYGDIYAAAASNGFYGSNTPPSDSSFPNVFQIVTDPTRVTTGKALRVHRNSISEGNWIMLLGGNRNNLAANYYTHFFVQAICRVGNVMNYGYQQNGGGLATPKLCILDHYDGSSNAGELVLTSQDCRGFVTAYTRHTNGASNLLGRTRATPANSANFQMQNAINRGTPLSDQSSYERNYGPFVYGMSGTTSPGLLDAQGTPDPDAKIGGAHWNMGGMIVIEMEVQLTPNRARYWWAPWTPGTYTAPVLVGDTNLQASGEVNFGSRAGSRGTGWSGLQLTNFITNSAANQFPTESWTDWCELIFSTQPIPFPGGYALP